MVSILSQFCGNSQWYSSQHCFPCSLLSSILLGKWSTWLRYPDSILHAQFISILVAMLWINAEHINSNLVWWMITHLRFQWSQDWWADERTRDNNVEWPQNCSGRKARSGCPVRARSHTRKFITLHTTQRDRCVLLQLYNGDWATTLTQGLWQFFLVYIQYR